MTSDGLLYHYTSASGLMGMLGNPNLSPSIWMTQVQYMNDTEEFYHAHKLAVECLVDLRTECPNARKAMSGIYGLSYDASSYERPRGLDILGITRLFSFSLTEMPDQLSQWRGYTPHGGYCIGFRVSDLTTMAERNGFQLLKCIYNDDEKRSAVKDCIRRAEADILARQIDPMIGLQGSTDDEKVIASARLYIQRQIATLAERFKNSTFSEENEWRVTGNVGAEDSRARWRTSGAAIIPYVTIDISEASHHPVPAVEVIVGPGLDFRHAKHAIEFMNFAKFGSVNVKPSASTLRW